MQPSLLKLQKFFKLEAEQGYLNRAVIGGFERLVVSWEAEARAEGLAEDLVQLIGERLRSYNRLSPSSRQESLQGLWRRIQRSSEGAPAGTQSPEPAPPDQVEARVAPVAAAEEPPTPGTGLPSLPDFLTEPSAQSVPEAEPAAISQPSSAPPQLAPPATRTRPRIDPVESANALNAPVSVISGVGPKHAQTLQKLGLETLGDLLYYFPRDYLDFSQLKPINRLWYGEKVTVIGTVESVYTRQAHGGKMQIVEALLQDGTGALRLTWFNQPWLVSKLQSQPHISVSGKIDQYLGRLVMNSPEWEPIEQQQLHTNRIVPIYPLTEKITQRWLRSLMNQVITYWAPRIGDLLTDELRQAAGLVDLSTALLQIHFPDSPEKLVAARHRLAFDEIFLLQMGVMRQRRHWLERSGRVFEVDETWLEALVNHLPFALTGAQQRAISDLRRDFASGLPMNRLLQGDVGSGKTVIAGVAVAILAQAGAQSAVMAPTSILAEQHYKNLVNLLTNEHGPLKPEEICLLVGATPEAEKRQIRQGLEDGSLKLAIGTHALIEDPINFADLGLVIVDEQHRFGVEQRAALRTKGENPHVLVMTATPIPRSLALTVYGDLDVSVMDEMPPGRQEISTHLLLPRERERAYRLISKQVSEGRQAFIIYPLVEESENSDAKAAVEEQERLQKEIFPDLNVGLLHGRMRPDEKDTVMEAFRGGEYHILVSTTVIEVGVDVPNATVMLIEGANRFGLAQLHQLRGRVGRGEHKSFCIMIPDKDDAGENERLKAMVETNNGFILAERDLEQRGPGDFLGVRQSGYAELRLASLTDMPLIEKARRHAQDLFAQDPELRNPDHKVLSDALERFWNARQGGDVS